MHTLLMFSAGHLHYQDPSEPSHKYYELHHRQQALISLRETLATEGVTENADALLAASTLLAFHACSTFDVENPDFGVEHYVVLMNGIRM